MAVAKSATVIARRDLGPDTRLLECACDEPLGFIGGQYVIVDSGQTLPSGKAAKRAYSFVSSDLEQRRFELAVKRLPGGVVSEFMHRLEPGARISFSGPWGKLFPREDKLGTTLVLATDTGVSAALGLLQGARFEPRLVHTRFVWLRVAADYFLPEALVRARVPLACGETRIERLPALGHPERVDYVRALVRPLFADAGIACAFIAGDGAVNYALLDDLVAAGVPATRDHLESFFNMPKKSA